MITKVVHCKREKFDIYIGRPGPWGNPFEIGKDGTRDEVIQKFREWILKEPLLMQEVSSLKGKILGCWCIKHSGDFPVPYVCHGQVLVDLAEQESISESNCLQ